LANLRTDTGDNSINFNMIVDFVFYVILIFCKIGLKIFTKFVFPRS